MQDEKGKASQQAGHACGLASTTRLLLVSAPEAARDDAPGHADGGQPARAADALQQHVCRDLAAGVACSGVAGGGCGCTVSAEL